MERLNGGDIYGFNIYARPFIPEALAGINRQHGHEIHTSASKRIDFDLFVGRYLSTRFLAPVFRPSRLPPAALPSFGDNDVYTQYLLYFQYHLDAEIQSQKQENDSYSLYRHKVEVDPMFYGPGQEAYSIMVPGLRENSPYIEEDDIIQIRQLRYDYAKQSLAGWTGVIYNARVLALQRRENRLVVRNDGLAAHNANLNNHHPSLQIDYSRFNIQFPVPMERYRPMQQALTIVHKALTPDNGHNNQFHPIYNSAWDLSSITFGEPNNGLQTNTLIQKSQPWIHSMLFPTEASSEIQCALNPGSFSRPFFDKQLNWEQKKAIESICSHNYGEIPFLISGPPGTGKTKTLVEVAIQLLKNVDHVSHILFCAPSDPAADTIVQRISQHLNQNELLRLNRPSRTFAEVPSAVLPFCCVSQDKFDMPEFTKLMSYKLVVTTCRDASLLLYSRVTNSDLYAVEQGLTTSIHPYTTQSFRTELHWTALLIDEAAQAMEPEALVPISVVASPLKATELVFQPLLIMAGDEYQLGPRTSLHSSPLKTSLFARLFARPVYANHPLARGRSGETPPPLKTSLLPIHRPAFANLIRNYRSHPAILAVPSALFYHDTLEPEAVDTNRLASWPEWRGKGWPVLFHDNDSEDELKMDFGGWYNVGEAQIACGYAALLVKSGLVAQKEICIMTPFKEQVQCLRKTIRDKRFGSLWDVDIGPTEIYQGLERGVVILCTTRSKQSFVESDKGIDWGIIGLPNKMNVALTRAKFGLIVIGKREVLVQDPNWKAVVDFCDRNGLNAGKTEFEGQISVVEEKKLTRLEKVLLSRERDLDSSESESRALDVYPQEDEMWTSGMQAALDVESVEDSEYSDESGEREE